MRTIGRACIVVLCWVLPWLAPAVQAQVPDYPNRPLKLIVAFTSGLVGTFARALAQHYAERLGQPVAVDNRPGASQAIGAEVAAKSPWRDKILESDLGGREGRQCERDTGRSGAVAAAG